jgi:ribonucleoside-diphosphate reductase alpha chain
MITLLPILSSNQPEVKWTSRSARIENDVGKVVFEQQGIEAPDFWSDMAVRIVASKYFYGAHGTLQRESSIKKMIHRVVNTIVNWGYESGYYDDANAKIFYNELTFIFVHQLAAFNSPVWFNVGLWHEYKAGNGGTAGGWAHDFDSGQSTRQNQPYVRPQGSACFIQGVDDTMESIMALATSEAALFKFGSGTGTDLTPIRSSRENLSGGGRPSGPMSFLRIYDQVAGSIKSGGKTRRAAKMNTLRDWHPDIEEFITAKKKEEQKAHALIDAGYDGSFNGEAYASVAFQNENLSVRVSDEFMNAAITGGQWSLKAVTTGEVVGVKDASKLLDLISEGTWFCGDPGIQYDGAIQDWHTCAGTEPIHSTNPCAEYIFLNNTACNLASLNLLKFKWDDGRFDIIRFQAAVRALILAQDILVDWASYPTMLIADNSHIFRTLGLGYANLGALVMSYGLPYDSDKARGIASSIASLMTGEAYLMSAMIAEAKGPFKGYNDARCAHVAKPTLSDNVASMHRVISKHVEASHVLSYYAEAGLPSNFSEVIAFSQNSWHTAKRLGEAYGFRNAQVSVLAPTGCLVGGSLIQTDMGLVRLSTLGKTDGPQWQEAKFSVWTDEGPRNATKFYVNGRESTRVIKTSKGFTIQGTLKHKIKCLTPSGSLDWKKFANIVESDIVPISLGTMIGQPLKVKLPQLSELHHNSKEFTVPEYITPELAELVGYFMGDGSWHVKGLRFSIDARDTDVLTRLKTLSLSVFGLEAEEHPGSSDGMIGLSITSEHMARWWIEAGFQKLRPHPSHSGKGWVAFVPDPILGTNDSVVYGAFLRGLFEADGHSSSNCIELDSTDEQLIADCQSMFMALGVLAYSSENGLNGIGQNPMFGIYIPAHFHEAFKSKVSFISQRKGRETHSNQLKCDFIPVNDLNSLLQDLPQASRKKFRNGYKPGWLNRHFAVELAELTQDEWLKFALGFYWDQVEEVKDGGIQPTFDISVPSNVTYMANGFISHNTIAFMMDCDTTGVEPDIALVKYKLLAGSAVSSGYLKIVNNQVPAALKSLGYRHEDIVHIVAHIAKYDTIEDVDGVASGLNPKDLAVFDCALKPSKGSRSISWMAHINMMAAIQPFISGAISKTINMPSESTVDDIRQAYILAWQRGLKCVAIYRNDSKRSQPLNTSKSTNSTNIPASNALEKKVALLEQQLVEMSKSLSTSGPMRRRLPDTRAAKTHKFDISGHEGYVTVGTYDDGCPGELFIQMAKEGSTMGGLMDTIGTLTSISLQYGVPLDILVSKFSNQRFEPHGFTSNANIRTASSIIDYIFRWMSQEFTGGAPTLNSVQTPSEPVVVDEVKVKVRSSTYRDGKCCHSCGSVNIQITGTCAACLDCGSSLGCS